MKVPRSLIPNVFRSFSLTSISTVDKVITDVNHVVVCRFEDVWWCRAVARMSSTRTPLIAGRRSPGRRDPRLSSREHSPTSSAGPAAPSSSSSTTRSRSASKKKKTITNIPTHFTSIYLFVTRWLPLDREIRNSSSLTENLFFYYYKSILVEGIVPPNHDFYFLPSSLITVLCYTILFFLKWEYYCTTKWNKYVNMQRSKCEV